MGLCVLWVGGPVVPVALAFYGAGIGLESIARGTLPLALFGPERYAIVMGRIARPSSIAQAAAPSIGAVLLQALGTNGGLAAVLIASACNVLLVVVLFWQMQRGPRGMFGKSR